jgi:type I restriction enzyme, S subunit
VIYEVVKLGEICSFLNGGTPSRSVARYFEGEIPWITSADLVDDQDVVTDARFFITEEAIESSATKIVPKNNILLVSRTGVGKVAITGVDICISQDFTGIVPNKSRVDLRYLFRFLQSCKSYFIYHQRGATIKGITRQVITDLELPVPPLGEQQRIAAILDKADALRAKRRAALAKVDTLLQATFLHMFGDPVTNPMGWKMNPFGKLAENQDSIRVPVKQSDRANMQGQFPYYGASGIIDYVDDYLFDGERLLIAEDGANLLARSSPIAFIASGKFWVNNHAHVVAFNGNARLRYLEYALLQTDLQPYVTGSAQPKLNRKNLDRILLACPPIGVQDNFLSIHQKVNILREYWVKALGHNDNLFHSLQQRAFKGEL